MANNIDYSIYKDVDVSNPDIAISTIKDILEKEDMFPEQRLFAIHYVLNKNVIHYTKLLKDENNRLTLENRSLRHRENTRTRKHIEKIESAMDTLLSFVNPIKAKPKAEKKKVKVVVKTHKKFTKND